MENKAITGGEFVVKETACHEIFIPEEFGEEARMIQKTIADFVAREIIPDIDRLDDHEHGLLREKLGKVGELGLFGISIPEEYGGFGANFVTGMLATEEISKAFSFSVAFSANTGIGTLPILYYGTKEQKEKYIPRLAAGELISAYALTEPGAGSDPNAGKTKAVLSADGKNYIINGDKMWITNGGVADIFIVFAKIDDDKDLSAFIVEKGYGGIKIGAEENKMGIKGSSTTQLFFEDCPVPVENMLAGRQEGFKMALNVLNMGRIKLCGGSVGAAKAVIEHSVKYANERVQGGRLISKYGAIKFKLAEQAIRIYAAEAAVYRASQNIEDAIKALMAEGQPKEKATIEGIRRFAIEDAILKVAGSEMLDYVTDEAVQIFGGMGYSAESAVERAYRDSRINRIFEGTNEINRLLTVSMLLQKAMKGELNVMGPAQAVAAELTSIPDPEPDPEGIFGKQRTTVKGMKKSILMVAGAAVQKLMQTLAKEQEIIMNMADMAIQTYLAESIILRVEKLISIRGEEACAPQIAMVQVFVNDAADRVAKYAKDAIWSFAEGPEQRMMLMGLKRFTKTDPFNVKEARRVIAEKLIEENKYCF